MRKIFTPKKNKLQLLSLVLLLIATISNAQFVERWSNVIPSHGSFSFTKHAVSISSDGNIVASGDNKNYGKQIIVVLFSNDSGIAEER
jgi:hypothetical protein